MIVLYAKGTIHHISNTYLQINSLLSTTLKSYPKALKLFKTHHWI
jgi:hypothetical protein